MAKVREITVSRSGVIPIASYENLRPSYSIRVELDETDSKEQVIEEMQAFLRSIFEHESNRAKADLIDQQYTQIRFYDYKGKKYPSVTSILNWGKQWKVTDDELSQYASRGTIVGDMVEHFLSIGKWLEPEKTKSLQEDVSILLGGSLGMHWTQCSHIKFCKQFKDKIVVQAIQGMVVNEEAEYAGTYDIVGNYESKRSLCDVKCGGFDMRQLAAYAMCLEGIEQLVVLPVGPTDNKCGYKKPIVCTTIQKEYEEFLKARAKFRARFGI